MRASSGRSSQDRLRTTSRHRRRAARLRPRAPREARRSRYAGSRRAGPAPIPWPVKRFSQIRSAHRIWLSVPRRERKKTPRSSSNCVRREVARALEKPSIGPFVVGREGDELFLIHDNAQLRENRSCPSCSTTSSAATPRARSRRIAGRRAWLLRTKGWRSRHCPRASPKSPRSRAAADGRCP